MQHTILIVDDEENILRILRLILERNGYAVIAATNAHEALEKVAQNKIDAIISDIMMPDMNGYEFGQKIKENPATAHIPLIFLTAKGEITDKFTGYFVGAAEYITKPFETEALLARVRRVLEVDELERIYHLDSIEPRRIAGTASATVAPAQVSSPKVSSVLQLYNAALGAVQEQAARLLDADAVSDAFARALTLTAGTSPVIESLKVTPAGIDENVEIDPAHFDEINRAMSELLGNFLDCISRCQKPAKKGIHILILDSAGSTADIYAELLESAGFFPSRVRNITEAKKRLEGDSLPNLMILDTTTPASGVEIESQQAQQQDALEFYKKIRDAFPQLNVPLLIIADKDNAAAAIKSSGADSGDCLIRPFSETLFIRTVVSILRRTS